MQQPPRSPFKNVPRPPQKVLNKTFFRFLFSFVAVLAGTLLLILVLGVSNGA